MNNNKKIINNINYRNKYPRSLNISNILLNSNQINEFNNILKKYNEYGLNIYINFNKLYISIHKNNKSIEKIPTTTYNIDNLELNDFQVDKLNSIFKKISSCGLTLEI